MSGINFSLGQFRDLLAQFRTVFVVRPSILLLYYLNSWIEIVFVGRGNNGKGSCFFIRGVNMWGVVFVLRANNREGGLLFLSPEERMHWGAVFVRRGMNKGVGEGLFCHGFGSNVSVRTNSDSLLVKLGEGG